MSAGEESTGVHPLPITPFLKSRVFDPALPDPFPPGYRPAVPVLVSPAFHELQELSVGDFELVDFKGRHGHAMLLVLVVPAENRLVTPQSHESFAGAN